MSTILDALRKSEQERKLNKLPTLTDMAAPHEPPRWPVYIGLALVLLAIALVVLAYVIWSAKPEATQAQNSTSKAIIESSQSADAKEGVASAEGSLSNNAEGSLANNADGSSSNKAEGSSANKDSMQVNVVSYSDEPALRFAMVNGRMVREGEFVEPGLKVEEILIDAVVFNARGKKVTRGP